MREQVLDREGAVLETGKVTKLMARRGLGPAVLTEAEAGDIVQVTSTSRRATARAIRGAHLTYHAL